MPRHRLRSSTLSKIQFVVVCLLPEPSAPARGGASEPHDPILTYSAEEERQDVRLWRTVVIGEQEHRINMKMIEPYMRVISHGGGDAASLKPQKERRELFILVCFFFFKATTATK